MSKNFTSTVRVIGYYDKEEGDCYCLAHSRNYMLPIINTDKDFSNERCSICGVYIDDPLDTEPDFEY